MLYSTRVQLFFFLNESGPQEITSDLLLYPKLNWQDDLIS